MPVAEMTAIIKIENPEIKKAVEQIVAADRENYQSVYNQVCGLDGLKLKEARYGSVVAGSHPHRREYQVYVSRCELRRYGYKVSDYQIHLNASSQSQSDKEEAKAIEEWLKSKGL